jgi:hypothetical protein
VLFSLCTCLLFPACFSCLLPPPIDQHLKPTSTLNQPARTPSHHPVTPPAPTRNLQTTAFGVNVGAGGQFALEHMSSASAVFISAMASKVQDPPLALPSIFPPMTPEAIAVLKAKGRDSFKTTYGTHFVFGFRMGAFLVYNFKYIANQQATKAEIALSLNAEAATTSASAALDYKRAMAAKNVNIVSSVRTNSYLPPLTCGDLVVSEEFDPDKTKACIQDWITYPPQAAYGAFAVPFEFHPTFQANLPPWEAAPDIPLSDSQTNPNFKAAGILRLRLNAIMNSLDSYPFKEDRFYGTVQNTLETANSRVNDLLTALRLGTITSFMQWQQMYKLALGQTNVASEQANFVPPGRF